MVLFIETKGTPYESGLQQGEQLKKSIKSAINGVFGSELFSSITPGWMPVSFLVNAIGLIGRKYTKKPLKKYLPRQHEKLLGIAKGSGLSKLVTYGLNFLEVINGNPRLVYKNPPASAPPLLGCSMILINSAASESNVPIMGRNYDFPNILRPYQMVRRHLPDDGLANLTISQYPLAGCHMGVNEKGVTICYNYGRSWKSEPLDYRMWGAPGTAIIQEALETCETADEAIKFVSEFPARSNGIMFGILDKDSRGAIVESTSTRYHIREFGKDGTGSNNGVLIQTNTYQSNEMKDANLPMDVRFKMDDMDFSPIESPIRRLKRINELVDQTTAQNKKMSIERLKEILSDHYSYDPDLPGPNDFTVCTHGPESSTLASIIIKPSTMEAWVTDTNPCLMDYEYFKLTN